MILKEMLNTVTFKDIWLEILGYYKEKELEESYVEKIALIEESYKEAWESLMKLEPAEKPGHYFICAEYFDCLEETEKGEIKTQFDVSMYNMSDDTIYSIMLTPWEEILGLQVANYCLNRYGAAKLAAELLFDITFFGYNNDEVNEQQVKVKEELAEAVENLSEEHGIPFDEFMKQLEEETGVEIKNEPMSEEEKEKFNKYLKLNHEITDFITTSIKKQAETDSIKE